MSKQSTNLEEVIELPKLVDDIPCNKLESLQNLVITYISNNPHTILTENKDLDQLQFHERIFIPSVLADALFHHLLHNPKNGLSYEKVILLFTDTSKCCLQRCQLRNIEVPSGCVCKLCYFQNIQHLELFNITFVDFNFDVSSLLRECAHKLLTFHLHNVSPANKNIKCLQFHRCDTQSALESVKLSGKSSWCFKTDQKNPVPLVSLELNEVVLEDQLCVNPDSISYGDMAFVEYLPHVETAFAESTFQKMMSDDESYEGSDFHIKRRMLSDGDVNTSASRLGSYSFLTSKYSLDSVKNTLLSLSLFDCDVEDEDMATVFQLKKLRHLDISCPTLGTLRKRKRPTEHSVWRIMEELPDLMSLDLSCTEIGDNLYVYGKLRGLTGERCLRGTTDRKLDFLGLCESEGCEVVNIYSLANQVAGYHSEHQIMVALEHYRHKSSILVPSFNSLYRLNRHHSISCPHRVLKLLLTSIERFPMEEDLVLTCTANLFFLTREHYMIYSASQRQGMVMTIMRCLQRQERNKLIVRNVLLTLYHFEVPGDFIFQFGYVTTTLLNILVVHQDNPEIGLHAINLCNTMVSSMKHDMKGEVSRYNFVETIMFVIKQRLEKNVSDEVLQVLWSTLWNVTDETPKNSQTFVQRNGLDLIERCFAKISQIEVHKNMMGLVGNIAEVKFLRPDLMESSLIARFHQLLIEENQNLEVAYNVAGTLSHLLSDGSLAWTCPYLNRNQVRKDMYVVIETWDLQSPRNINYRSFNPILGLIYCDVAECVHWAVWALWNLSFFDSKYCALLWKENGLEILGSVETRPVRAKTKEMAREIIERVQKYLSEMEEQQ